jgi:hypothetical protein
LSKIKDIGARNAAHDRHRSDRAMGHVEGDASAATPR